MWSGLPGQVELAPGVANNGKEPGKATYRVTVPAGTPVGVGMIRLATDKGVSNARLLLVDDLEAVADNGANKATSTAQELKLPCAVDGACEPESFDFYRIAAKAGQRVAIAESTTGQPKLPKLNLCSAAAIVNNCCGPSVMPIIATTKQTKTPSTRTIAWTAPVQITPSLPPKKG